MSRFVCVYASNLAACIGANRYKPRHEVMEDMWRRLDPAGYDAAFSRNRVLSRERLLAKALRDNEQVAVAVAEAALRDNASSSAAESTAETVKTMIDTSVSDKKTAKLVKDHVQSRVFTRFGTTRENDVFAKLADAGVDARKHEGFLKKRMGEIRDKPWYLGGKIDAITADRTMVVEIKNRIRRLFRTVPEYENVQLQSYMHLLDIDKAALVECFTSPDKGMEINVMEVARDRERWESTVEPALREFVSVLFGLLDDEAVQDAYVSAEDRDHFITAAAIVV
jgi:hypothetical protein